MKRKAMVWLCAVLAAVTLLAMNVSAADYTGCADTLSELGLFKGTGNVKDPYELDRAPNRYEAAVMLVRLLGKEQAALAESNQHPFTDVPSWAGKHIGYLYQNGLTRGSSATQYGGGTCTAQMYATFVLRSLGYSDGAAADFTYAEAVEAAQSLRLYQNDGSAFLRDDAVSMSYNALGAQRRQGGMLLDKLVSDGAIESAKAQALRASFDTYRAYAACHDTFTSAYALDMSSENVTTIELPGLSMKTEAKSRTQLSVESALRYANVTETTAVGKTTRQEVYFTGNELYLNDNGAKEKYTCPQEQALQYLPTSDFVSEPLLLCDVESITVATVNGETVYTIKADAAIQRIVKSMLSAEEFSSLKNLTCSMRAVVKSGVLDRLEMSASFQMKHAGVEAHTSIEMTGRVNAVDAGVTVASPTAPEKYKDGGAL